MSSKKLYRFISLESFIELLDLNEEIYALPSVWKDSYEGCALQFVDKEDNRKRFIEILVKQYLEDEHFIDAIIDNYVKAEAVRYCTFAQCWSYKKDSDALWNKFGYGNHAIQISSNINLICRILDSQSFNYRIEKIHYDINTKDEPNDFTRFYERGMDFRDQFFHKRPAFRDEGEYRVIILRDDYNMLLRNRLNKCRQNLMKQQNEGKIITADTIFEIINEVAKNPPAQLKSTLKVKVKDVSKYIRGVRVHPDAEPWYVDMIKSLCLKYNVNFVEKSTLYEKL